MVVKEFINALLSYNRLLGQDSSDRCRELNLFSPR